MRLYRLLLRLFPASFRTEYGDEMCAIFTERRRRVSDAIGLLTLWTSTLGEFFVHAIGAHWDVLRQDLRYTARTLLQSPGFTATVVLVTALGIGANTAVFSITDHVLLRPLPFADSDRLVEIWEKLPTHDEMASPANYRDWKNLSHSFQTMAAFRGLSLNLSGNGDPIRVDGAAITADMLPMLGRAAIEGRIFGDEDDRETAPPTMLLSYPLWKSRFAGDPKVIGMTVRLDDVPCAILGVMPPDFHFPRREVEFWTPMRFAATAFSDRNDNYRHVVAKRKPGLTLAQARSEMDSIARQLQQEYPKENGHTETTVFDLKAAEVSQGMRMALLALMGAAVGVLLIACANLSSLLLSRALPRQKEIAIRTALGAGRERLVRQILTESLVLTVTGGVIGILVGRAAMPLLARLVPANLPVGDAPTLNVHVLAFAVALIASTTIVFGIAPAYRTCSDADFKGLREGSRFGVGGRRQKLRQILTVAEVGLSLALLICSGLLFRAMLQIRSTDPGFRSDDVLTLRTVLPMPSYENTAPRNAYYDRVLGGIRKIPGVTGVGFTSFLPMDLTVGIWPVNLDGQPEDPSRSESAILNFVTPGFFNVLRIPLREGRDVKDSDTADTPYVAVVSDSFAKHYWPGQDPIGRHFKFALSDREVVGVVGNVHERGLEEDTKEPQVYIPHRQVRDKTLVWYEPKDLVVRSTSPTSVILPELRRIIHEADPELPISNLQMLSEIVDNQTLARRVHLRILAAFASVSLLLAGVGIHGLLAFTVSQRIQEIGVRMALGARSGNILRVVLGDGFRLTLIGIALGITLAYGAARVMESLLAGVHPDDSPTVLIATALSLFTATAGGLLPAIRAIHVDPAIAMRAD